MTVDDSPVIAERLQFMLSEIDSVEFLGNALNISAALQLIDQRNQTSLSWISTLKTICW